MPVNITQYQFKGSIQQVDHKSIAFLFLGDDNWDKRRMKRQVVEDYVDHCPLVQTAQKCVLLLKSCYRVLNCDTVIRPGTTRQEANCDEAKHIIENVRCCKPCCLIDVKGEHSSPPCSRTFTKEELCSNKEFL